MAIVLSHEVLLVLSMFTLNLLHPEVASCDYFVQVSLYLGFGTRKGHLLAGRQPKKLILRQRSVVSGGRLDESLTSGNAGRHRTHLWRDA